MDLTKNSFEISKKKIEIHSNKSQLNSFDNEPIKRSQVRLMKIDEENKKILSSVLMEINKLNKKKETLKMLGKPGF